MDIDDYKSLRPKVEPERLAKLLKERQEFLGPLERQRQYVAGILSTKVQCPMCFVPCSVYDASDETRAIGDRYEGKCHCPNCKTELVEVVPFMSAGGPGWHWRRAHPIVVEKEV
jgi:hypothetical protein